MELSLVGDLVVMERLKTRSLIIKMWEEELSDDSVGMRGEVRDPLNRETKYFSDWPMLKAILEASLGREMERNIAHTKSQRP